MTMTVHCPCDVCLEDWPFEQLILIDACNKMMCPVCINKTIDNLYAKIKLAECQYLGCGGRLTPDEIVKSMREVLNDV